MWYPISWVTKFYINVIFSNKSRTIVRLWHNQSTEYTTQFHCSINKNYIFANKNYIFA